VERKAQAVAGIEKLARQAMESPEEKRGPILGQMRALVGTAQAQFPDILEAGESNGWPFARLRLRGSQAPALRQPQGQPQAQAKTITRAEMAALGVTEAQAKAEGYTITQ